MVTPDPAETVVTKHRYGAFHDTELDERLDGLGRPSLLFAGVTTNVCVETSLREALCRDYLVSIVEDCCAAFDVHEHDAAVENVRRYFGTVVTLDQLTARWMPTRRSSRGREARTTTGQAR